MSVKGQQAVGEGGSGPSIEIVRSGADPSGWTGYTSLSGSAGDLREALYGAAKEDETAMSAGVVLSWLDSFDEYPPPRSSGFLVDRALYSGGGGHSWTEPLPEEPLYTPPLPFDFFLPSTASTAPLRALEPWWSEVAITPTQSAPVLSCAGDRLVTGTCIEKTGRWSANPANRLCTSAAMRVYEGYVDASASLSMTTSPISAASLVGALIPGYGELRDYASMVLQRTEAITAGGRIPMSSISALTFENRWSLRAPMLSFKLKKLVGSRGYGEHDRASIGIEFSDGWRPFRALLVCDLLPVEEEDQPFDFFRGLAEAVARDRLLDPSVNAAAHQNVADGQSPLRAITGSDIEISESEGNVGSLGELKKTSRIELPGSRPISVALDA